MVESAEEIYVREQCFLKFGTVLRKIPESTVSGVQTADFELLDGEQRVAVIEVKQFALTPRTAAHGWVEASDIPEMYGPRDDRFKMHTRDDFGPTKIGRTIDAAWRQLRLYESPKILVFVNDEHAFDVVDLQEAWNGFLDYGTAETGYLRNVASKKIARGRIRDAKGKIDLYVWFDRHYGKGRYVGFHDGQEEFRTEGPLFRCSTLVGYELARHYFGCQEMEIPEDLKPPVAER